MATIKRYRYIVDNYTDINEINNINNKTYVLLKVYKGNSSNQAELISNNLENFEIEEISTDIDFTKTTFTEAEVEAAVKCNAVSNFKVGDILTINNTYCSQWVVIGKNHDGTTGTIDIMSTTQVDQRSYNSSGNPNAYNTNINYAGGMAIYRSYNEFTNVAISSSCKTIKFKVATSSTDGTTVSAKAKIISCIELNFSSFDQYMPGYGSYKDGEPYSDYFPAAAYDTAVAKRWVPAGSYGNDNYYWPRSKSTKSIEGMWLIVSNGATTTTSGPAPSYGVVPIVRLGSMIYDQ